MDLEDLELAISSCIYFDYCCFVPRSGRVICYLVIVVDIMSQLCVSR